MRGGSERTHAKQPAAGGTSFKVQVTVLLATWGRSFGRPVSLR